MGAGACRGRGENLGPPGSRGADKTVEGAVESAGGVDALAVPAPASTAAAMASVPMDRRQWRILSRFVSRQVIVRSVVLKWFR